MLYSSHGLLYWLGEKTKAISASCAKYCLFGSIGLYLTYGFFFAPEKDRESACVLY